MGVRQEEARAGARAGRDGAVILRGSPCTVPGSCSGSGSVSSSVQRTRFTHRGGKGVIAPEIEQLIGRLRSADANERDAAVARLRVIGSRALSRLTALVTSSQEPAHVRVSALRALDGAGAGRSRAVALIATADDDENVAAAAIAVLAGSIGDVDVLDAVTALALDPNQTRRRAPRGNRCRLTTASRRGPAAPATGGERNDGRQRARRSTGGTRLARHADGGAPLSAARLRAPRTGSGASGFVRQAPGRTGWSRRGGADRAARPPREPVSPSMICVNPSMPRAPLPLDFLTAMAALGDADSLEPLALE